jgi:ATP-dependent exoDNAse (exonuclease V) beta subunit
MPTTTGTFLQEQHAHPRDQRISFQDEGHVYTVDGVPGQFTSVTTLVHKFFPPFDCDRVIQKLVLNAKSAYFGREPQAIKDEWKAATDQGSQLHEQIEVYFDELASLGGAVPSTVPPSVEFVYFLNFFREHVRGRLRPYRTEWYVFDEDIGVCGSIDMVFVREDDPSKMLIYDWKRSKEIRKSNHFEKGLGALSHLDSCNFNHYSLQLNTYKYILEHKYGAEVVGMYLVVLHPRHRDYQLVEVAPMDAEVRRMISGKEHDHEGPRLVAGNVSKYM